MLQLLFLLLVGIGVCFYLTKNSAVSIGWAIFFCLTVTPIITAFIVWMNGKYGYSRKPVYIGSIQQKIRLIAYAIISVFIMYKCLSTPDEMWLFFMGPAIALIGNIFYVISDADTYNIETEENENIEESETIDYEATEEEATV